MLSVGSRNERKVLGFCVRGEMEENELEEGEAFYQDDDDAFVDDDVALSSLSYIEEKLQDVLGHFQKDFEGGVSAENLGAKFGGYGSFLPTCPRSPSIWSHESHPRTSPKVQASTAAMSPNNLPLEGARQNLTVTANASHSVRVVPASSSIQPAPIAPHVDKLAKRDTLLSAAHGAGEFIPKQEHKNRSVNDRKMPTSGSDNVSARNNAAIYTGLGLDISPSSSPEDFLDESGGLSSELRGIAHESPRTILEIMTSFPVPGGCMLSPIPESLLRLTERSLLKDSKAGTARKAIQEVPTMFTDELPPLTEMKGFGEMKMKPVEKNGRPMVMKIVNAIDLGNDMSDPLKKEIDNENLAGREMASNALKVPLPSRGTAEKIEKQMNVDRGGLTNRGLDPFRDPNNGTTRDRTFSSDAVKEEALESTAVQDTNRGHNMGNESVPPKGKLNKNTIPEDKVLEEKKTTSHKDLSLDPKNDGRDKGEKTIEKVDYDGFKGRKDHSSGSLGPPGQKADQKATQYEQDGVKMSRKKDGKKKLKGHKSNGALPGELQKDKEGSRSRDSISENKIDVAKSHKESSKSGGRESQSNFPREVKAEQAENKTGPLEKHFKGKPKDQKVRIEKETLALADKSKERSAGKKIENPSTSEACAKASAATPLTGNGPTSDAVPALAGPPVLDNWVCCDRCQTWRLLPFGMNSEDLPEKWICSMITWLPGMNSCTFSEEETTKALNALYVPVPVPESQNNIHGQYNVSASGMVLADMRHLDQSHELGSHAMPSAGKKKHALKDMPSAPSHVSLTHIPISNKKNQQAAAKSISLNDVNQPPSKSNDFAAEKPRHKQKEKSKLPECYSDGGGYMEQGVKHSKGKGKRDADRDDFMTSKKIKAEGSRYTDEDRLSDHGMAGKAFLNSSNCMLIKVNGKNSQKHSDSSSAKELKGSMRDDLQSVGKKAKTQVQVPLDGEFKSQFGGSNMGRSHNTDFAVKKRKVKEWQESQDPGTLVTNGNLTDSGVSLKEEISETELRKAKKGKISKSEGKESAKNKADGTADKKGRVGKIVLSSRGRLVDGMEEESRGGVGKGLQPAQYQGNAASQRILDGMDSLKRDLGYPPTSMAATSSSSKVSGSRKSKAGCQEMRGSPVESVSSSPFRVSNMDKLTTERPMEKDSALNAGFSGMGSPRRCLDGEGYGGTDRSGIVRKEQPSPLVRHGSLENRRAVEASVLYDCQDGDANQTSGGKANVGMLSKASCGATEFENANVVNSGAGTIHQHNPYLTEVRVNASADNDLKLPNHHDRANGSGQRKPDKGSSRSRDGQRSIESDFDKANTKDSDYFNDQEEPFPRKNAGSFQYEANVESRDHSPYHEDLRDGKFKSNESCGIKSCHFSDKKDSTKKWSSEGRRDNQSKFGVHEKLDGRSAAVCSKDGRSNLQQNLPQVNSREDEKLPNGFLSSGTDQAEMVPGRGQVQSFPPSGDKHATQGQCPPATSHKESRSDALPVDASNGDSLKMPKQPRKPDNPNGARHSTPNGFAGRDQAAASAIREAKDIKHSANRLLDKGQELESTDLYFQASLKFLHAASLLETCNVESAKHGETTYSMKMYSETAKLCEFCAHKYERLKEMAAAALAYKCMEVAHMRVIYCKHYIASKDWHELHTPLQVGPPGESPSSSASDVDNLNNQAVLDRAASAKGVISPQTSGNHVIPARNRPNFERILKFTRDVDLAMEALRRWQNAFASANVGTEESRYGLEGISSVKRVLDFSFHDVMGLLRLVRLATEAIGR
ncbi:cysteine-tryptophan domain-containing zinc finger protein 7-like isoform X2 [Magnolia sinica]|uniref:cysteine-tryptophan domain-containing zinc finger protein 7-like isoform X2 n=1 Tax=Magnolia sinica TaxID=86752 RepID=UPI002658DDA2|nr:cysteine-tryptophan domain-containing zinc finger protein 7-like isoform X2 [Magnolia sinica]